MRLWWRVGHAQGKILRNGWLFPGLDPMDPLSTRQLNRAIHAAADAAKIDKRVSMPREAPIETADITVGVDHGRPSFVCAKCGAAMIVLHTFVRCELIRAPPAPECVP